MESSMIGILPVRGATTKRCKDTLEIGIVVTLYVVRL